MNPQVVRTTSTGKHVMGLIQIVHTLYKDFNVDIFDHATGMQLLQDRKQLETIQLILKTSEPINTLFVNRSEASYQSLQCKDALEVMGQYLKKLRQKDTRKKNQNLELSIEETIKVLSNLSKKSLIKQLIENVPPEDIRKLVQRTQKLQEAAKTKSPSEQEQK